MPYVDSLGIRINYRVEGEGPPLVLQHGSMSSMAVWLQAGYTQALRRDFQCILIDARGHGDSGKPHDPSAYTMHSYVHDVCAVLDDLHLDSAHYWGYSMGGWIAFCLAKLAPERMRTLIIGGAHALEDRRLAAFQGVEGDDPDVFIAAVENLIGETVPPEWRPLMLANDLHAIVASIQPRPALQEVLQAMQMPCLLYAGRDDSRHDDVKACASQIANANFCSFENLNHIQCMVRSKPVLPAATQFLAEHKG